MKGKADQLYSGFRISNFGFDGSRLPFRNPQSVYGQRFRVRAREQAAIRNCRGFSYIALLAAIVIIGITLGSATKYWQSISARDKEEELLFRGEQYRLAIERYYTAIPGRNQFPQSIDDLLKDGRTPGGKRYLRQKYKDPITGEDFIEIRDQVSRRILGVCSSSDKEPIKQANFPDQYKDFDGKKKYSDWKFQFAPQIQTVPQAGSPRPIPAPVRVR